MATHFEGPLLGSVRSLGGLFYGFPVWVTAVGEATVWHTDFFANEGEWVATNITSGTADIIQDLDQGVYRLDATTANQGLGSVQWTGADLASEGIATPAAGRVIAFEALVRHNLWDNSDWFIGLAETDTTFMDAAGAILANGGDNCVGFRHLEAGTGVPILVAAGTALANLQTVTSTRTTALDNSAYFRLGIRVEGTNRVRFYLEGQPISAWFTMGTAFDGGMVPTFAMIANGVLAQMDVDYVTVAQNGRGLGA